MVLLFPAARLQAYQEQVKQYGKLIHSTDRYQIYLSPFLTCEKYDFGQGQEHWMRVSVIFQQAETLPLDTEFEGFFFDVLLPKVKAAAPAACKAATVNLTNLHVDFYFLDYEPKDQAARMEQGVVARAMAVFKDGRWRLRSGGDSTIGVAQEKEAQLTEKVTAARELKPYGEALKWIQASSASEASLPPGVSAERLLIRNDRLAIYAGAGYNRGLCEAGLNLTLVFSEDALVPGKTRAEYEDFFEKLFSRLESDCPDADVANVVHYMRGQSHPALFDQPHINRITLRRKEAGSWRVSSVDDGGPIFVSAADIGAYRQAQLNPRASSGTDDVYAWAFGKLLFAVMAEGVRRQAVSNDAELAQLLSTLGRDGLVASALSDLFPDVRREELQYMTRYVGLAMSGRLTPADLAQGTAREYLVQKIEEEDVIAGRAARFADLLLDLESQRSGSSKR